jgi:hypothetical protein
MIYPKKQQILQEKVHNIHEVQSWRLLVCTQIKDLNKNFHYVAISRAQTPKAIEII